MLGIGNPSSFLRRRLKSFEAWRFLRLDLQVAPCTAPYFSCLPNKSKQKKVTRHPALHFALLRSGFVRSIGVPAERYWSEGTRSTAQGRMMGQAVLVTFVATDKSNPLSRAEQMHQQDTSIRASKKTQANGFPIRCSSPE